MVLALDGCGGPICTLNVLNNSDATVSSVIAGAKSLLSTLNRVNADLGAAFSVCTTTGVE